MIMVYSQQEKEPFKKRFIHLKTYIQKIKQKIQPDQQSYRKKSTHLRSTISQGIPAIHQPRLAQYNNLLKQKQLLQMKISQKMKHIHTNNQQKQLNFIDKRVVPSYIKVYISPINIQDKLEKIGFLLTQQEWENYRFYRKKDGFVFINQNFLGIKINFLDIACKQIQKCKKFIKFYVKNIQKYFVLKFNEENQANNWLIFLKAVSQKQFHTKQSKWNFTNVTYKKTQQQIIKSQMQKKIQKQKQKIQYKNNLILSYLAKQFKLKNDETNKDQLNLNFKKSVSRKGSMQNSSFFLSNSSQKNKNQREAKHGQQQDYIMTSINFQTLITQSKQKIIKVPQIIPKVQHKIDEIDITQSFNPKIQTIQSVQIPINLLQKIQEKKKLLKDISASKLGIHWHQDPSHSEHRLQSQTSYQVSSPQRMQRSSKQSKLFPNKKSFSSKKNQVSTRRDSNQSPIRIKRVQSATRQKSISRQSDSNMQFDRGKVDYSVQLQKMEHLQKRKFVKNQIRDHYLHRLMQKQTIKQLSKSSSSIKQQTNLLVPIPQRKRASSKYSMVKMLAQNSLQQQSHSLQQKQSTQQQIRVQQLKNGIVLQKCSKDAWSIKLKKLYISNAMTQICYSDVQNPHEQKKYLIRDIKSIQYGRVTNGILSHKKKRCDEQRCLLIKIDNNGKQKLLEFYLEDSQPVQNLLDFAKKLHSFVERQNQHQQSQQR